MSREVAIVSGARTPIGKFGGVLRETNAVEMGAHAIYAAVERARVDPTSIDEVVVGHARQASNGPNPGRLMSIGAAMPVSAPVQTVQQACVSSMKAVILATQSILLGDAEIAVAAGSEHMSSIPFFVPEMRWGKRMGDAGLIDGLSKDGFRDPLTGKHMGELADAWSARYNIGREDQDTYALRSQRMAQVAKENGFTETTIAPFDFMLNGAKIRISEDEHPRPQTTMESLARLDPAFVAGGSVTAGNSSGITDGAGAIILMSAEATAKTNVEPLGWIRSYATAAVEPADYGLAVAPASAKAMDRAAITYDDLDVIEINEAFAIQVLAACKEMKVDPERVNTAGGAIALGHPVGMSGVRVVHYATEALRRSGGRWALATICGNGGQGAAIVIERA